MASNTPPDFDACYGVPIRMYTLDEIGEMLDKAKDLGFDLGPDSPIESLTLYELSLLIANTPDC